MMTINKVRRCKRIIASPNYYHDRAIQMGELYGTWAAESELRSHTPSRTLEVGYFGWIAEAGKQMERYSRRMNWYVRRYSRSHPQCYEESMDYNT